MIIHILHWALRPVFVVFGILGSAIVTEKPVYAADLIWAPPHLEQIIEEGLAQNGEIQGLIAMVESFKEGIPFAGSLDDPIRYPQPGTGFGSAGIASRRPAVRQPV